MSAVLTVGAGNAFIRMWLAPRASTVRVSSERRPELEGTLGSCPSSADAPLHLSKIKGEVPELVGIKRSRILAFAP